MEYHVMHKETGEEKTMSVSEVNDMVYGDDDQVIVFDTALEAYLLIEEYD